MKGILTQAQRDAGLRLEESSDHLLFLKRNSEVLATFSQLGATAESIRKEAEWWLQSLKEN